MKMKVWKPRGKLKVENQLWRQHLGRNDLYDSSERRRTAAALIIWHCFSLCSQLPEHVSFSSSAKEECKQALYAKLERSTGVTSTNPHYQGSHGAALNGSCLSSDGSS